MSTATFNVSGMHCSSCSMLIVMNLEDLPGVISVKCDHATGKTVVEFEAAQVSVDELSSAIVSAGYTAELVG